MILVWNAVSPDGGALGSGVGTLLAIEVPLSFEGSLTPGEELAGYLFTQPTVFPPDLVGSLFALTDGPPTGTATISLYLLHAGAEAPVGSITIASTGAITLASPGFSAVAGDVLIPKGPLAAIPSLTGLAGAIVGAPA